MTLLVSEIVLNRCWHCNISGSHSGFSGEPLLVSLQMSGPLEYPVTQCHILEDFNFHD